MFSKLEWHISFCVTPQEKCQEKVGKRAMVVRLEGKNRSGKSFFIPPQVPTFIGNIAKLF